MRNKPRPIRDLYFRFIKNSTLDGKIESQQAALYLYDAELIELVPSLHTPSIEHYRDTQKMKELDDVLRDSFVRDVIRNTMRVRTK